MHFVHRPYQPGETIAAIATPPGEGGIAIIRISGKEALQVGGKIFSGPVQDYDGHTAHFGAVIDLKGNKIDDALLLVMRGRRSFTGEDTVEIQCHGGMIASRKVLEAALAAGARAADPGEFTFRAFMNGKLDLAQAESIQQLIGAKSEKAFEIASSHLEGELSRKIASFQKHLSHIAAILEAWVDFPEEGLEFATMEEICSQLRGIVSEMRRLLGSFHNGRRIHHGISLSIVGCPNAGKSSLLNALLDKERAIVTPIAGTTRDILEEEFSLGGILLRLIDTAGIRETDELIEQEGIRRSKKAMREADLVLLVLDAGRGMDAEDEKLLREAPEGKTILVWNKIDLPGHRIEAIAFPHSVQISAKERIGLEGLCDKIEQLVWGGGVPSKDEVMLTNLRHKEALGRAVEGCEKVVSGLDQQISPEFLTLDMRFALLELGTILGTNVSEDILSSIFSHFCIGK